MKQTELEKLIENKVRIQLQEANDILVKLPRTIQNTMTQMSKYLKVSNLTRRQQLAALYQLINELGLDSIDLTTYIGRIKAMMRTNKTNEE